VDREEFAYPMADLDSILSSQVSRNLRFVGVIGNFKAVAIAVIEPLLITAHIIMKRGVWPAFGCTTQSFPFDMGPWGSIYSAYRAFWAANRSAISDRRLKGRIA